MVYSRITLVLDTEENIALRALAKKERREPRAQAELIIRSELERQGFLSPIVDPKPALAGVENERIDQR